MNWKDKRRLLVLRQQTRKVKKEKEEQQRLEKMYMRTVIENLMAETDVSPNDIIEAAFDLMPEGYDNEEVFRDSIDNMHRGLCQSYQIIKLADGIAAQKLETFIETELYPYYNDQSANIFL